MTPQLDKNKTSSYWLICSYFNLLFVNKQFLTTIKRSRLCLLALCLSLFLLSFSWRSEQRVAHVSRNRMASRPLKAERRQQLLRRKKRSFKPIKAAKYFYAFYATENLENLVLTPSVCFLKRFSVMLGSKRNVCKAKTLTLNCDLKHKCSCLAEVLDSWTSRLSLIWL